MNTEIRKDDTIKMALLEMGFPFSDADNKEAEEVKTASFLFDTALTTLLIDECFTMNIKKIEAVLTDRKMYLGKFEYVKPKNFLCALTPGVEEREGNLYTFKSNLNLEYKEKIDVKDIPIEYQRYLALIIAKLCCPSFGKVKSLNRILLGIEEEKARLAPLASYDILMEDLI